jgi:sugar transferase EpsL
MLKSLLDKVLSLLLIIVFAIPILIVALLVWWFMGYPVLYVQERPGLHGKIFKMYKFRSMTNEKDQDGKLLPNKDRLPPFGRFLRKSSLDELPELINVLKGDMSLVGPRPLRVEYLPLYSPQQGRRHNVKPGITGWAQVNGRNSLSWDEKFALDVWYVENQSLLLDLKILFLTAYKVIKREGVNQAEDVTMEPFKGIKL